MEKLIRSRKKIKEALSEITLLILKKRNLSIEKKTELERKKKEQEKF